MLKRFGCGLLIFALTISIPDSALAGDPCPDAQGNCPEEGCIGQSIDNVVSRLKNRTDPAENPETWTLAKIIKLN
jgi:hypothetical protein